MIDAMAQQSIDNAVAEDNSDLLLDQVSLSEGGAGQAAAPAAEPTCYGWLPSKDRAGHAYYCEGENHFSAGVGLLDDQETGVQFLDASVQVGDFTGKDKGRSGVKGHAGLLSVNHHNDEAGVGVQAEALNGRAEISGNERGLKVAGGVTGLSAGFSVGKKGEKAAAGLGLSTTAGFSAEMMDCEGSEHPHLGVGAEYGAVSGYGESSLLGEGAEYIMDKAQPLVESAGEAYGQVVGNREWTPRPGR